MIAGIDARREAEGAAMPPVILVLIFAATSIAAYLTLEPAGERKAILSKLAETRRRVTGPAEQESQRPARFSERIVAPWLGALYRWVLRVTPGGIKAATERRLQQAGKPISAGRFLALEILAAATGVMFWTALAVAGDGQRTAVAGPLALLLAACAPRLWLGRLIARRMREAEKTFPDAIDLLSVSVEAGLGFDSALLRVSNRFPGALGMEFREYLTETKLGRPRAEALRALAVRLPLPEVRAFAAAIIQAEELGTGLTATLRAQAREMRQKRRQKAEERAMKAPVKMLFPLVLFIFPAIFVILLGPVVIHYMSLFSR